MQIKVFGYVDTSYTAVPVNTAIANANNFISWMGVNGIFLDQSAFLLVAFLCRKLIYFCSLQQLRRHCLLQPAVHCYSQPWRPGAPFTLIVCDLFLLTIFA